VSNREKGNAIPDTFTEAQLANLATMLQSVREHIREATENPEQVPQE